MLTILVCAVIGFACVLYGMLAGKYPPDEFMEWFFTCFVSLGLGGLVGGSVGVGFSYLLGFLCPKKWYEYKHELVALRGSEGTSGRLFLGSGSIGQSEYYFYYEKSGNGYAPGKIGVDGNVTVYEEEREDGQMLAFVRTFTWWTWVRFFVNWPQNWRYEFHIPKGSLKQEFHLG